MRILIARTVPGESTSMDVYADGLVAALRRVRPEWAVEELTPPGYLAARSVPRKLAKYGYKFVLYPELLRRRADVYHIVDHSYGHLARGLAARDERVIVTCHDVVNLVHPANLASRSYAPAISLRAWEYAVGGLRRATQVVAISAFTAGEVERLLGLPPARLRVVPVGIDAAFRPLPRGMAEAFRRERGAPDAAVSLLHVGNVSRRKNVETLLGVTRALRDGGTPVCLWKVGEEWTREHRAYIAEHDLAPSIMHLGTLPLPDLVRAYNAADVLLHPSLYEGFGMTVLEAMACGTPVVAADASSLPEAAGDAALLAPPTDVERLAAAVLRLREDGALRRTLVRKGIERARAYTWDAVAERFATIYEGQPGATETVAPQRLPGSMPR